MIEGSVHACNILRVLFRDSVLGDSVLPYVEDGVMFAINGFKADSWPVSKFLLNTHQHSLPKNRHSNNFWLLICFVLFVAVKKLCYFTLQCAADQNIWSQAFQKRIIKEKCNDSKIILSKISIPVWISLKRIKQYCKEH